VIALMREGKTDREIKDAFIQEYGERILAEPEGVKAIVLTTVPLVTAVLGFIFLAFFLSRHRERLARAAPQGAADLFPDMDWE
jgi:cytochrome c-type biogenesis protein CcmH/NrfF